MTEEEARSELCRTGRRLYRSGLVAGTAGNFSVRLAVDTEDRRTAREDEPRGTGGPSGSGGSVLLVTPRGAHKGRLSPEDLVRLPLEGATERALARATTELPLHRAIYRTSPSVRVVLHTHAPCLTALGLRELSLESHLPEVEAAVGRIRTIPFAPSGTDELGRAAAAAVDEGAAVLVLRRHGALAVGRDLEEAENRMELAELSARTVLLAHG